MRVKEFGVAMTVSRQFMVTEPGAVPFLFSDLDVSLSHELRGPRGGRYAPFGEIEHRRDQGVDDVTWDTFTLSATRKARYVRPKR